VIAQPAIGLAGDRHLNASIHIRIRELLTDPFLTGQILRSCDLCSGVHSRPDAIAQVRCTIQPGVPPSQPVRIVEL
jgi:hypothetical protein